MSGANMAILAAVAIVLGLGHQSAQALNYFWDTNGSTAGSGAATGTWSTTNATWTTNAAGTIGTTAVTTANADDIFFSAGTNGTGGTVTVNGTQSAHSVTFQNPVNLKLSGGAALNLGNATAGSGIFVTANAVNEISTPVILNSAATAIGISNSGTGQLTIFGTVTGAATTGTQTITVGSSGSGNITLSGIIGDGGGGGKVALTVNNTGSGITFMTGNTNTYTGNVTLSAGVLQIASSGSLTTLGSGASALSLNGGELWLRANGSRAYGRNTTVGGNVTITADKINATTASYTLGNLTIGAQTLTVALGATALNGFINFGNVTMTGASTFTVNNAEQSLSISGTFANGGFTPTFNGTGNVTLTGIVSGSGGLTQAGSGILRLNANNTYNGTTTVSAGTLAINSSERIANTSNLLVNGGTFNLGAFNETVGTVTMSSGSIGGSGNLTGTSYALQGGTVNAILGGGGAVTVSGNTTTLGSAGRLGSGKALTISGGQLTIAGAESVASYQQTGGMLGGTGNTLTSTAAYDLQAGTVNANLGGSIGVNKTTAGTLTLTGSNSYAGITTVSAGTLLVSGAGSINSTAGVSVASGATFTNSSSISYSGGLTLAEGAVINGSGAFAPTALTITADLSSGLTTFALGNTQFTKAGNLELTLSGIAIDTYALFSGSAITGTFSTMTIGGASLASGGSGNFSGLVGGNLYTFTDASNQLIVAVPEPSTWGALLAFALTAMVLLRRRSRSR